MLTQFVRVQSLAIAQIIGLGMQYSNYVSLLAQIFLTQLVFPRHIMSVNAYQDLFGVFYSTNAFALNLWNLVMVFAYALAIFIMSQSRINV